jgi:hypothetical protein
MSKGLIRVELPHHLQTLANAASEIVVEVESPITAAAVIDAVERRYPMLCGTIRDHVTKKRRPFLRYFGCQQDLSHDDPETPLPVAIVNGTEPFIIWGALSGG